MSRPNEMTPALIFDRSTQGVFPVVQCWEWNRQRNRKGYGMIKVRGRTYVAHRVAFEIFRSPIPDGMQLDHLCRNRGCVNPLHLEPVTGSENVRRGISPALTRERQQAKTHCPQGHPYDEANTYYRKDRPGRECRACLNERTRNRGRR